MRSQIPWTMIDNVNQSAKPAERPVTGAEDKTNDGIAP
ncbi:hypothetical protein PBOI14_17550 [Pseudomonas sp. Boi14]|nr:hypothetical protein PBOI14_17550 [Pseudomonas sp. Boi14]